MREHPYPSPHTQPCRCLCGHHVARKVVEGSRQATTAAARCQMTGCSGAPLRRSTMRAGMRWPLWSVWSLALPGGGHPHCSCYVHSTLMHCGPPHVAILVITGHGSTCKELSATDHADDTDTAVTVVCCPSAEWPLTTWFTSPPNDSSQDLSTLSALFTTLV